MKYYSYLNTAVTILTHYPADQPFSMFIKDFFRTEKKYGSTDRKQISHLCYCYFRLGKAATELPIAERIMLGVFLCSDRPNDILLQLKPEWNEAVSHSLKDKAVLAGMPELLKHVFPWQQQLSDEVEDELLAIAFFTQPDLYLRVRPGHKKKVVTKLSEAGISFRELEENCLAMANNTRLDELLVMNREVVIQDRNSQRVGELMKMLTPVKDMQVWDCCAASGGKSIMAYDLLPGIRLTVSDIRENILANLRKRFTEAGITGYTGFTADASRPIQMPRAYDLIIADVPCSGSGTWGRTPEQLSAFTEEKIDHYARLQQQVITHAVPHLKSGGYFLYITCSVFREENEQQVDFLLQQKGFLLLKQQLFKGYEQKADTLFAALFQKK